MSMNPSSLVATAQAPTPIPVPPPIPTNGPRPIPGNYPGNKLWPGESITPAASKARQDALKIDATKIFNGGIVLSGPPTASQAHIDANNTVQGPQSIAELARALRNDPQKIYQFVHDNISWQAYWGLKKGALGCLVDGSGNSFDQSALLIALLRQAGYTANYVLGTIELQPAQYNNWFGTSGTDGTQAMNYCFDAYIPAQWWLTGGIYSVQMSHVWVQCTIGGTIYSFDPSCKTHTWTAPIANLETVLGYTQTSFMSAAETGATIDPSGNYVQNLNRANVRSLLQTYSTNLANWIKTNNPAATMDQILGGAAIVPATIPLLQTSLPYETAGETPTIWTSDVPLSYKSTVSVRRIAHF
ncbi:MAG: transglutaminase domain-containing protein [Candidatus Obscuribacterales bacterium]|nr:transglutaminase domain-containing protein [Candidatus Obscuribacterales bacterium]